MNTKPVQFSSRAKEEMAKLIHTGNMGKTGVPIWSANLTEWVHPVCSQIQESCCFAAFLNRL